MDAVEEQPKKSIRARWFVLALIITTLFVGCPLFDIGESVDGRIVDAETGHPIANAHLVGIWELEGGLFEHAYLGPLYFEESLSDKDGRFHLDGFWFRFVPPNLSLARLQDRDPVVYLFAEGYRPRGSTGKYDHWPDALKDHTDEWVIPLQRMAGVTKEEASRWHSRTYSMKDHLHRCNLVELPQTIAFLEKMQKLFRDAGSSYRFIYDEEFRICQ